MASTLSVRRVAGRPVSSGRRDLLVALASVWLAGGLFLDGWAHAHVPELETFFTPWHGVLYSGYAALAISHVPSRLWRGRPEGPIQGWVPTGYGLGLLGAVLFAAGGVIDMTWHTLFGIEVDLEALLSPPHLLLLTSGSLMIATPIRAAAAKLAGSSLAPVLISACSGTAVTAFFLSYLSPFTDAPAADIGRGGYGGESFGLGEFLVYSGVMVTAVLFTWSRLGRVPPGLITVVVAAASIPNGVFDDFSNASAQLWPLLGAVLADAAVQWTAATRPRWVPLAAGVLLPALVWPAHLLGVELSLGVHWSLELWSGIVVLCSLAGAALGGLFLPHGRREESVVPPV